ncbi:MAG: hypothetical protein KJ046_00440 [Anaerolineae bacterium]|nr:hypothetical protein [Anaerolineae bacterium]
MIEFVINYWMVVLPTTLTGTVLLIAMKKQRDNKVKKEKALIPALIPGRRQE